MELTVTDNRLAETVLGTELNREFTRVDTELMTNAAYAHVADTLSIDDFAKKYLSAKASKALSNVDLKAGDLEMGLEIERFRLYGRGRGLILLLALLIVVAIVSNVYYILVPFQSLIGR
ncbi:MAG TPA: hypothetical protein VF826_19855 [Chloroflexia bacterium]|jgi:hypothetical protein